MEIGPTFLEAQVLPIGIDFGHGHKFQMLAAGKRVDIGASHSHPPRVGMEHRLAGGGRGHGDARQTERRTRAAPAFRTERRVIRGMREAPGQRERRDKMRVREGQARSQRRFLTRSAFETCLPRFRSGSVGSPFPNRGAGAEPLSCFLMASPRSDCFTTFAMRSRSAGS